MKNIHIYNETNYYAYLTNIIYYGLCQENKINMSR